MKAKNVRKEGGEDDVKSAETKLDLKGFCVGFVCLDNLFKGVQVQTLSKLVQLGLDLCKTGFKTGTEEQETDGAESLAWRPAHCQRRLSTLSLSLSIRLSSPVPPPC